VANRYPRGNKKGRAPCGNLALSAGTYPVGLPGANSNGVPRDFATSDRRTCDTPLCQARKSQSVVSFISRRRTSRNSGQIEAFRKIPCQEELVQLAKDMRAAEARGENLGLSDDELAFYDALETNDSAVKVLGDETLRTIARELVATVRKNVTIDWAIRDNVRAQLRVLVKRICASTATHPTNKRRRRKPCSSRRRCCRRRGASRDWSRSRTRRNSSPCMIIENASNN